MSYYSTSHCYTCLRHICECSDPFNQINQINTITQINQSIRNIPALLDFPSVCMIQDNISDLPLLTNKELQLLRFKLVHESNKEEISPQNHNICNDLIQTINSLLLRRMDMMHMRGV